MRDFKKTELVMCKGDGCPFKEKCYRFTTEIEKCKNHFAFVPFNKEQGRCEMFWGEGNKNMYNYLKDIAEGKA